jgi:hypothetical protein
MPNNNRVENHFRKVHCFSGKTLQQVLVFTSSIPVINNPLEVELLPNDSAPIDRLPIFRGYKRRECQYLTKNKKRIIIYKTNLNY